MAILKNPFGDELAVAHVCLLNIVAKFDAVELSHKTIQHILVIFRLISIGVIKDSELLQLGISEVIQGEKVGTSLLEC